MHLSKFYCLEPQTALSSNYPHSSVIPGQTLILIQLKIMFSVSVVSVATTELPLNPCKAVCCIHNILWQAFEQPH